MVLLQSSGIKSINTQMTVLTKLNNTTLMDFLKVHYAAKE